jgi:hypothetical protein
LLAAGHESAVHEDVTADLSDEQADLFYEPADLFDEDLFDETNLFNEEFVQPETRYVVLVGFKFNAKTIEIVFKSIILHPTHQPNVPPPPVPLWADAT